MANRRLKDAEPAKKCGLRGKILGRDLIDLAMMSPPKKLMQRAVAKARAAYGDSVVADLAKAIEDLRVRPHRLDQCMQAMAMTTVSKAALWARTRALAPIRN